MEAANDVSDANDAMGPHQPSTKSVEHIYWSHLFNFLTLCLYSFQHSIPILFCDFDSYPHLSPHFILIEDIDIIHCSLLPSLQVGEFLPGLDPLVLLASFSKSSNFPVLSSLFSLFFSFYPLLLIVVLCQCPCGVC